MKNITKSLSEKLDYILQKFLAKKYKTWVCKFNSDSCDFCKQLHGQRVEVGEKFKNQGYELSGPPAHKGCNCKIDKS